MNSQSLKLGRAALAALLATGLLPRPHAGEAPELAAQVAAGTLPPLEERLPANPLVVPVVERDRRLRRHLALGDGRRRRRAAGSTARCRTRT